MQRACIAGALLSTLATIVLLAAILAAVSLDLLRALALPLAAAGIAAAAVSGIAAWRAWREPPSHDRRDPVRGRPFSLRHALQFVAIVAATLLAAAALRRWFGAEGALASAAMAGFADVHAAAVALGQQASAGTLSFENAELAFVAAFATNSIMKCLASLSGGVPFVRAVVGGIVVVNIALVTAAWYGR